MFRYPGGVPVLRDGRIVERGGDGFGLVINACLRVRGLESSDSGLEFDLLLFKFSSLDSQNKFNVIDVSFILNNHKFSGLDSGVGLGSNP